MKKFLIFLFPILILCSCGKNLFENFESKSLSPAESLQSSKVAISQGNYYKALKYSQEVITKAEKNPGSVSEEQLLQAHLLHAQANLGIGGVNAATFAKNVLEELDNLPSNPSSSDYYNIINNSLSSINLSLLQDATKELNEVMNNPSASSILTTDDYLTIGISNALNAVITSYNTFDTNKNGKIERNDFNNGEKEAEDLWNSIKDIVINSVENSYNAAKIALDAGGLTSDEEDLLKNIEEVKIQLLGLDDSSEYYFSNQKLQDGSPNPNYEAGITILDYIEKLDG